MDSKVIAHVFGAVNSAERTLQRVEGLLPLDGAREIRAVLPQQKLIVKRMRRVANLLQLEAAREDWAATVRSLRIFYGLHHMIRKDLLHAHKCLVLEKSARESALEQPATVQEPTEEFPARVANVIH